MDLNTIIPLVLNLLSGLQNVNQPEKSPPLEQKPPTAPPNFNNAYWQLPNYDEQNNYQNTKQQNFEPKQEQPSKNSQLDINAILQIIQTLSSLFPQKPKKEEEKKEVYPSYISKLPRTDRFTFD